jgi:hypothetical protein
MIKLVMAAAVGKAAAVAMAVKEEAAAEAISPNFGRGTSDIAVHSVRQDNRG